MAKTSSLLLLQYNNYYNRIVKLESSVDDYINGRKFFIVSGVNFNPNDSVNAEQIINTTTKDNRVLDFEPDYCVILDEFNEITSRWFITKSTRTRGGQYNLQLRRDVISDYYNDVTNAPCYIEKGYISDINDSAIFNNEGLLTNQIKKKELFLSDGTYQPWIVGYMAKNHGDINATVTLNQRTDYISIAAANLEAWDLYDYTQYGNKTFATSFIQGNQKVRMNISTKSEGRVRLLYVRDQARFESGTTSLPSLPHVCKINGDRTKFNNFRTQFNSLFDYSDFVDAFKTSLEFKTAQQIATVLGYRNKIIKFNNNKFYRVNVSEKTLSMVDETFSSSNAVVSYVTGVLHNCSLAIDFVTNPYQYMQFTTSVNGLAITVEEIDNINETININIPSSSNTTKDAQYDIFCIPLPYKTIEDLNFWLTDENNNCIYPNFNTTIEIANAIGVAGGTKIYDIQVLPFSPLSINDYNVHIAVNSTNFKSNEYSWVTSGTGDNIVKHTAIFYPSRSNITFNVQTPFNEKGNLEEINDIPNNPIDFKIENETKLYRLVSPSYQGQFEFSLAKNYGSCKFNVDCTFKPYNPYIHINPIFEGLYGKDFNDTRGLICNGDFSISRITDAFINYQLQNKNYESIFNRQIENMEVNNAIAMKQAKWQVAGGAISGAASGAVAGAMVGGGPVGAAVGASVGAVTSVAGGLADLNMLGQSQRENVSYAYDMYSYSLRNIQAMPYSLTKNTSLTGNSKFYPFIEVYDCTDVEKEALRNKIKYDGMTIMRIGKIQNYINTEELSFIKGQIIRMEDLNDNSQIAYTIYDEIAKGVYF